MIGTRTGGSSLTAAVCGNGAGVYRQSVELHKRASRARHDLCLMLFVVPESEVKALEEQRVRAERAWEKRVVRCSAREDEFDLIRCGGCQSGRVL